MGGEIKRSLTAEYQLGMVSCREDVYNVFGGRIANGWNVSRTFPVDKYRY
jgi:hypothetical protein